ncbi:MAG: hypothetical protein RIC81_01310 [Microcella pacifica]|jgi:hypothetical protein|uniref:hypothetical protein n=1 Tax=Microcella TaxID=337004 RepID=UPI0015CF54B3|nr:hypothetical protein [Microcella indica]
MPDSLRTPDPDVPQPTDVAEYSDPPELRVDTDSGHTYSPRYEKEKVWTSSRVAADDRDKHDIVWAFYNRFRVDELDVDHTEWRVTDSTDEFRVTRLSDGRCQREQKVTEAEHRFQYVMVSQFYELWRIDKKLETYYEGLLGPVVSGGGSVGLVGAGLYGTLKYDAAVVALQSGAATTTTGTLGGMTAGGSLAAAGGAAAVLATATGAFLGTTTIMRAVKNELDVETDGFAPIGKFRTPEVATGETRTAWRAVGEPYDCPDAVLPPPPPLLQRLLRAWWFWAGLIAVIVLILLIIALLSARGTPGVGPGDESTTGGDVGEEVSTGIPPLAAIDTTCRAITHSPSRLYPDSPSWFLVALLLAAVSDEALPADSVATVTIEGADQPTLSSEIADDGSVVLAVPISSYGTYAITDVRVDSGDETASVPGALPVVDVTSDEEAVVCTGPGADTLRAATGETG